MFFSHIYDNILKIATLFLCAVLSLAIPGFEDNTLFVLAFMLALFLIVYFAFVRTVATFLYCRFTLKMPLTLSQARQLNEAVTPVFFWQMKWLPLAEIKDMEPSLKFGKTLELYAAWKETNRQERKQNWVDFKQAGTRTKLLTVIMYFLVGYLSLASFFSWPPVNIFGDTQDESMFNNPAINICIWVLPVVVVFRALDKHIK